MTLDQLNDVAYIRYIELGDKRLKVNTEYDATNNERDYFELNGERIYDYDWYIYDVDGVYADSECIQYEDVPCLVATVK